MASKNFVHCDLAARNVLVGHEKLVKISDSGMSRRMSEELVYMDQKARRLPVKWMSVEAIFEHAFTVYSDVYVVH